MNDVGFPGWRPDKSIQLLEADGLTQVSVKGKPYMRWRSGDEACVRLAMVQLHQCGLGTEQDLAEAFGRHVNSLQRYLADFAAEGMRGLMPERRGPKGRWKLTPELRGKVLLIALREGIWKLEAIQQRLAQAWHETVSVPSIQEVLEENGLGDARGAGIDESVVQGELFGPEQEPQMVLPLEIAGPVPKEQTDVSRRWERENVEAQAGNAGSQAQSGAGVKEREPRRHYSPAQRVYLDQLEQGAYNTYAGGLLFAPLVARYDLLPTLRRVITIPTHEGYSLDALVLTLFYLDVFGFGSMEDFKRAYAEEFGVLMGRVQSPSLFTLRRFLHKVRKLGQGEALIEEFALSYLKSGLAAWGVMYIDGHFLPYYGLHPISKGWHGVRQMPMKGSYNFLAVDERFAPWLFLIRSCSEDLLQKIPELIEKAKGIGKRAGVSRERLDKLIVVFDREGSCAELYRYLEGKDQGAGKRRALFISWAKYSDKTGERSRPGAIQPGGAGDLRDPEGRSDPLPGSRAHDEQVRQDSGRGDPKWEGQKASGHLHQRQYGGNWWRADRAIDVPSLGRGECHQGTVVQAPDQLHPGLRPGGFGRAAPGGQPRSEGTKETAGGFGE